MDLFGTVGLNMFFSKILIKVRAVDRLTMKHLNEF